MGKGDKRTKKGKINAGSYGNIRPATAKKGTKKGTVRQEQPVEKIAE
ncbi:MAG: 30S ribosomal protein THX [Saprospiraceae bacterium]|nr:30S ribosomal protein THX [Saprospiraceae bacterium]